jgi:hypothetical protein
MKKYVVGYINFFDNELVIKIVEASTWQNAIGAYFKDRQDLNDWLDELPATLEETKVYFFDNDSAIDVVEL